MLEPTQNTKQLLDSWTVATERRDHCLNQLRAAESELEKATNALGAYLAPADELHKLDLVFASSSGMKLRHMRHDWHAYIDLDGVRIDAYGSRPWLAVAELLVKVVNRHES
jgi:hypothetical protein